MMREHFSIGPLRRRVIPERESAGASVFAVN
jgi:hypothetical protein